MSSGCRKSYVVYCIILAFLLQGCHKNNGGNVMIDRSQPGYFYFNILENGKPLNSSVFWGARYFWYSGSTRQFFSPYGTNATLDDTSKGPVSVSYYDEQKQKTDTALLMRIGSMLLKEDNTPLTYYIEYPDKTVDTVTLMYNVSADFNAGNLKSYYCSGGTFNGKPLVKDTVTVKESPAAGHVYRCSK